MIHRGPSAFPPPAEDSIARDLRVALERRAARAESRADYWRALAVVLLAVSVAEAVAIGLLLGRACP